jgi:hypothetical protein
MDDFYVRVENGPSNPIPFQNLLKWKHSIAGFDNVTLLICDRYAQWRKFKQDTIFFGDYPEFFFSASPLRLGRFEIGDPFLKGREDLLGIFFILLHTFQSGIKRQEKDLNTVASEC